MIEAVTTAAPAGGIESWHVGVVVAALSALGVAVRWSAGIIRDSMRDTQGAIKSAATETTTVIRDNTAAFAKLTEWLGRVDVRTEDTHSRVVEVHREISDVHEAPAFDSPPNGQNGPNGTSAADHDDDPTPVSGPRPRPTPRPGTGAYQHVPRKIR